MPIPIRMNRQRLLSSLGLAESSLHDSDIFPILKHFCFLDTVLYAWNDTCAVVVEDATGLTCAIRGDVLLGLLKASTAETVGVVADGPGTMRLESDGGNAKIPTLTSKEFLFVLPDEVPIVRDIPFTEAMQEALATCLLSVGVDALKPEYMGVTLRISPAGLEFFSTDQATLSRCFVAAPSLQAVAVVVPRATCEQVLKILKDAKQESGQAANAWLSVGNKYMELRLNSKPGVTVVSKILPTTSVDFDQAIATQQGPQLIMAPIPAPLEYAMERALVLTARDMHRRCTLTSEGKVLRVEVAGGFGEMKAGIPLEVALPEASLCVDPTLVVRARSHGTHFGFGAQSLILSAEGFTHVIGRMHS